MGKRWKNKKRKAPDSNNKKKSDPSNNPKHGQERAIYSPAWQTNRRMEAYYAYQGAHDVRYDETLARFVECKTDDEREEERLKWLGALRRPLQASFRLTQDVDPTLRESLKREIDTMVGQQMELLIDKSLGNRSRRKNKVEQEQEQEGTKDDDQQQKQQQQQQTDSIMATTDHNNNNNNNKEETKNNNIIVQKMAPAKKIPFVPDAYQLSVDRHTIRCNPALSKFHDWLQIQNSAGLVTRQETVSMIPPVVLGVEPHHTVLDMCAAPGSKTSQMLEIVAKTTKHRTKNNDDDDDDDEAYALEPSGCIIANDSDPKRAYMLVHQLKRINSPAALVTSCDARFFPTSLKNKSNNTDDNNNNNNNKDDEETSTTTTTTTTKTPLSFDRVLADVPCSGDGTTRKNPGIWKRWWQIGSLSLHPLQLSIATQGAHLTKVGGYLCYSTCSMNPMENEAVVCELLRRSQGALELVDKRLDLPDLKRLARPGWTTWKVLKEKETKRTIRNREKKNNEKMKRRRREYAEKQQKLKEAEAESLSAAEKNNGEDKKEQQNAPTTITASTSTAAATKETTTNDGSTTQAMDTSQNGDDKKPSSEETTTTTAKESPEEKPKENDESKTTTIDETKQEELSTEFGPPPSWDEATLKSRVESVELREYKCYQDVEPGGVERKRLRPSVFPPTKEEVEQFGLEKCLRCMPHDMDTGGFFVALFRKVKEMPPRNTIKKQSTTNNDDDEGNDEKKKEEAAAAPDQDAAAAEEMEVDATATLTEGGTEKMQVDQTEAAPKQPTQKSQPMARKGKEHEYYPSTNVDWEPLLKYYGLTNLPLDQFMVRSQGSAKSIYFISKNVKEDLFDAGLRERVMVINTGLRAFERNTNEGTVEYRIAQDGVHFLLPYMSAKKNRKIVVKLAEFKACMKLNPFEISTLQDDELKGRIRGLKTGCFVMVLEGFENDTAKKMILVMWRCRGDKLNCLVNKIELEGMQSKIRCIESPKSPLL